MVHHELLNHVTVAPESVLALYSSSNHPSSSQALPSLGFFLEHLLKGYFLLPCFRIYTEFPKSDAEVCIFTARLACQSFTVRTLRTTAILTKSRRIITMKKHTIFWHLEININQWYFKLLCVSLCSLGVSLCFTSRSLSSNIPVWVPLKSLPLLQQRYDVLRHNAFRAELLHHSEASGLCFIPRY